MSREVVKFVNAEALRRRLPLPQVINALERACAVEAPSAAQRLSVPAGTGTILTMPAMSASAAGVKVVTVQAANTERGLPVVHSVYVTLDSETLAPKSVLDGQELTRIRTAAVSALATRHLARPESSRLVVFGTGVQAAGHVKAMAVVRPIDEVTVVGTDFASAREFGERLSRPELTVQPGGPEAVSGADIICTCTTSPVPVFDGGLLRPGTHVNAIGAFTPDTRELDETCVARARIAVDDRASVLAEAGDLLLAIGSGVIRTDAILADLAEVVAGASVRRAPEDVTVFKSVGAAWQDLIVAAMLDG